MVGDRWEVADVWRAAITCRDVVLLKVSIELPIYLISLAYGWIGGILYGDGWLCGVGITVARCFGRGIGISGDG